MLPVSQRTPLPTLAVVGHDYLKEPGIRRMLQDVNVAYFGLPHSPLHQLATYSCPVDSLEELTVATFRHAVRAALKRGIPLEGVLSLRDGNCHMAARVAEEFGWPGPSSAALKLLRSKRATRELVNKRVGEEFHQHLQSKLIERGISRAKFEEVVEELAAVGGGEMIFKPDRGSCSYHIVHLHHPCNLNRAWEVFQRNASYRGGRFVLEQRAAGRELAVETVVTDGIQDMRITGYLENPQNMHWESGHYVPHGLARLDEQRICRFVAEVHQALGLSHCVTHTELMLAEGGLPALVEVNPRLAGDLTQELHRHVTGIEYYRIAARIATGQSLPRRLYGSRSPRATALIKFAGPQARPPAQVFDGGMMTGAHDQLQWLTCSRRSPRTATNDDRSSHALVVRPCGTSVTQMTEEAEEMLQVLKP